MTDDCVGLPSDPSDSGRPRRAVPRYNLIATAELVDTSSDVRMSGRLSEISARGCFLDVLNTWPPQTDVRVRVTRDQGTFECAGKVIYALEMMGMGVAFLDPPPDQVKILESWLAELNSV
jgi:PilZ domain